MVTALLIDLLQVHYSNCVQKPATSFPAEDRSRYYDFVDTPVQYRPDSPLIERRRLSFGSEAQLRYACMTLFHSIETGMPYLPEETTTSKSKSRNSGQTSSQAKDEHSCLSVADRENEVTKKKKYDSGVELEAPQSGAGKAMQGAGEKDSDTPKRPAVDSDGVAVDVEIKQFYCEEDTPQPRKETTLGFPFPVVDGAAEPSGDHVTLPTLEHLMNQQLGGEEGESQQQDRGTMKEMSDFDMLSITASHDDVVRPTASRTKSETSDPQDINAWMDHNVANALLRTPSFGRPKAVTRSSSKLFAKDGCLRPQEKTDESDSMAYTDALTDQLQPSLRREISSQHGGSQSLCLEDEHRNNDREGGAVIIDSDGVRRVMTAEEEKQRHLDLQRAVMEKMFTGTIGASSSDFLCTANVNRPLSKHGSSDSTVAPDPLPGASSGKDSVSAPQHEHPIVRVERHSLAVPSATKEQQGTQKKRQSLIRKLSVLGLGKKKTNGPPVGGGVVGCSRIVEAS